MQARNQAMRQQGFTLLEVVIAMALVGTGIALALTAVSGGTRLEAKMLEQEAAIRLARAKLDEVLSRPAQFSLAADDGVQRFAGTEFGYRLQARKMPLLSEALQVRLGGEAGSMEEVTIEVFWGAKAQQQSYRLVTYRNSPDGTPGSGSSEGTTPAPRRPVP